MVVFNEVVYVKLSRREFLKLVAAMGATAFITNYKAEIVSALEEVKDYWHICWLNGAACTGCTISFAQATDPDILEILTSITVGNSRLPIALPDYMETIEPASGWLAEHLKERWKNGTKGRRILIVEGAIQKKGYCVIGGKDFRDHVKDAIDYADHIIAIGACACYGGIPSSHPNPTGAMGLQEFLREIGRDDLARKVINIPCCPGHPDHLVITLTSVMLGIKLELDEYNRPKLFFGRNMHLALCPYRPYYDLGIYTTKPGEEGCRYKFGCKGPEVMTDCALRKWNNHVSYCVQVGAPCIGCAEPGFPDRFIPFYEPITNRRPFFNIDPNYIWVGGSVLAGATAYKVKKDKKEE